MDEKTLLLKKSDGTATIEIVIGQAKWATYRFKLWDKDGLNPVVVGNGFSGDQIDDEFEIGAITSLNNRLLSWKIRVASDGDLLAETYHFTILIRQKRTTVDGGVFVYSGALDGVETVGDFVRLVVK